mmetsp:Transcript_23009/g.52685  ORF Transcript_23009/g.52685 Transcript_23009/m.52685 type:complete len:376 (-) Transcript_23009:97-1224(-)
MDPSADELGQFNNLQAALSWASVSDHISKPFLRSLGGPTLFRHVALIPKASFSQAIGSLKVKQPGGPDEVTRGLSPLEVAQLEAFRRACIRKCGGEPDIGTAFMSPILTAGESTDDLCNSVMRAVIEAHAGLCAVAGAAQEVRNSADLKEQGRRQAEVRHAAERQRTSEQVRRLQEERGKLSEQLEETRRRLSDEQAAREADQEAITSTMKRAEELSTERDVLVQLLKQRAKGFMVQCCANCSKDFVVSENGQTSCRYHPGRWVPVRNLGNRPVMVKSQSAARVDKVTLPAIPVKRSNSSSALANAGAAMLADKAKAPPCPADDAGGCPAPLDSPKVSESDELRVWSCCNSGEPNHPGCMAGPHIVKGGKFRGKR